jgi:His/Glu/Gln/Arg/opine family amino acid ABC transporter permease subunit
MEAELGFWQFSLQIIPRLWQGMIITLELTLLSGVFGLLLGLLGALLRISPFAPLRYLAIAYITFFRGTPLLLQILFIYFALPALIELRLDSFPSGVLALSLNSAAYFAEIFRAGIESIAKGQMEAARALGMSYSLAMRRIIIPQTFKRLIPPIVNELAALSKDTSLVSVVALSELLYVTQRIGATYLRPWEVYFWAALGYLLVVMLLTFTASRIEKNLARKGG